MNEDALNPKYIVLFIFNGVYHTASEDHIAYSRKNTSGYVYTSQLSGANTHWTGTGTWWYCLYVSSQMLLFRTNYHRLGSIPRGNFPCSHAILIEEKAVVWPPAMLYQLALGLRNSPCLLFMGFHYLFQLQILLWSSKRLWKKECLKSTHKMFMYEWNFY